MSDPKIFSYTETNDGIQVDVGTFFSSHYTFSDCDDVTGAETPINITDLVLVGTIKSSTGAVIANLVEVFDGVSTGFVKTDPINGKFDFQISKDIAVTANDLASYDIRYIDALLNPTTYLRGFLQFLITPSS
jgi:hypothetical protein